MRDDTALQRGRDGDQLVLLLRRHLELDQGHAEVLDQRIKVPAVNVHAGMGGLHVLARIDAPAPGGDADLVGERAPQMRNVGMIILQECNERLGS